MKVNQLTQGETALVSYVEEGVERRCFIPAKKIIEGDVDPKVLKAGVPYGVQWAKILPVPTVTPEQAEAALHAAGIWTEKDLRENPTVVISALQNLFRLDLGTLLTVSKKEGV